MNRETIQTPLKGFTEFIRERNELYEVVSDDLEYTDMGKGMEYKRAVVQRFSDMRFFAFKYGESEYNGIERDNCGNPDPMIGKEVFEKQVITTTYQ